MCTLRLVKLLKVTSSGANHVVPLLHTRYAYSRSFSEVERIFSDFKYHIVRLQSADRNAVPRALIETVNKVKVLHCIHWCPICFRRNLSSMVQPNHTAS